MDTNSAFKRKVLISVKDARDYLQLQIGDYADSKALDSLLTSALDLLFNGDSNVKSNHDLDHAVADLGLMGLDENKAFEVLCKAGEISYDCISNFVDFDIEQSLADGVVSVEQHSNISVLVGCHA